MAFTPPMAYSSIPQSLGAPPDNAAFAPDPDQHKRKVRHVTQACIACRERKLGCDSNRPSCNRCLRENRSCTWPRQGDGRGAYSKERVQSLHDRIAYLEHALESEKTKREPRRALSTDELSTMLQHKLVLGPDGLRQYGPPSPWILGLGVPSSPMDVGTESVVYQQPPMERGPHSLTDIQWYRWLPTDKVPLDLEEHNKLLETFFKYFASWGLRSQREPFFRDMHTSLASRTPIKLSHYSPMLHNAILAIATAYSDNPLLNNVEARKEFARTAERYMMEELRSPTLSGVQAMSHLATFHTGLAEQALGFIYFGICARMAQALGLRLDASQLVKSGHITAEEMHDRHWLFWSTFLQDKCMSAYLGLDISIPKPPVIRFAELAPQTNREQKQQVFENYTKLFLLATDLLEIIYRGNRLTRGIMTKLFEDLDNFWEQLPRNMQLTNPSGAIVCEPEIIMLNLAFQWLTILLHRPFYRGAPQTQRCAAWAERAVNRCDTAANRTVQLLECYRRLHGLRFVPVTAAQMAFSAGTVYVFKADRLAANPSDHQLAMQGVQKCLTFLREMEQTWHCANQTMTILQDLCRQQNSPIECGVTVGVLPPGRKRKERTQSLKFPLDFGLPEATLLGLAQEGPTFTSPTSFHPEVEQHLSNPRVPGRVLSPPPSNPSIYGSSSIHSSPSLEMFWKSLSPQLTGNTPPPIFASTAPNPCVVSLQPFSPEYYPPIVISRPDGTPYYFHGVPDISGQSSSAYPMGPRRGNSHEMDA